MRYRRNEGFRIEFNSPVNATFQIKCSDNHDQSLDDEKGKIFIHDMSLKGAKLSTSTPAQLKNIGDRIKIHFTLNEETFSLEGTIVWKREINKKWFYGLSFNEESYSQRELYDELKTFVHNNKGHIGN